MVTFIDGESDKTYYRHFRIIQKNRQDDYRSMREVAERRKKHFDDWGKPDLIIVDGGKGQLSVFLDVFREAKIPIIGLAKRFETLVIPAGYLGVNSFYEHRLLHSPALNLVQKIRNEAHRFAQGYHHKLVKQTLFESKK
jgi:excinuclease ABC subunit C